MSNMVCGIVWQKDLTRPEKFILLAYADFADDFGGSIFPSVDYVAWKTGYTRRQVQRITLEMRKKGYITKIGLHDELYTTMYQINLDNLPQREEWVPKKHGANVTPVTSTTKEDGVNVTPMTSTTKKVAEMSPDPLVDPLYNKGDESEQKDEDIRSRQDYIDLQNAIVMVCKRLNIMALQPNEVKDIDILYDSGAKPAELRAFYGRDPGNGHGPSSWWYANDWRGRQGQVPTPANVIDTLQQARDFKPEHKTTPSNTATKAWSEVQLWLNRKMKVTEFSSPLTIQVVRAITESELKSMPEKQEGFYKKKFVGLFKNLEKKLEQN